MRGIARFSSVAEAHEPSAKYLAGINFKHTGIGVIPSDWSVTSLREATDAGRPISYGIVQTGPNVDGGVPCIRVVDIDNGRLNTTGLICTSEAISAGYRRTLLQTGDLVMPLRGKVGDVAEVGAELVGANLTRGVALLSIRSGIVGSYCRQALAWSTTRRRLEQAMNGSALQEIPIAALRSFQIALPREEREQRAIASALTDVDALIAGLEKLIAKKRDLKQATMQQLLTGQTRLPGFSGDWVHKQLSDVICEISDGGTPSTSDSRNFGGDVPWVVIDDIQQKIAITRTMLTEKGLQACATRRWPHGTLIVSTGATIGEVGILQVSAATKQGICGIIFDPLLARPQYMQYWFVNNKKLLLSKAQGSSIKEIRAPTLVTLPVSIPEIDEQAAIAGILDDMDVDISIYESRLAKTRELKQGMMQELLTGRTRLV